MYQNIWVDRRNETVTLWDDVKGKVEFPLDAIRYAYRKKAGGEFKSLYGDELEEVMFYADNDHSLFESDVSPEVKTLSKLYEDSDDPSEGHRVGVIDIEIDTTGGFGSITEGDKAITAIAIYDIVAEKFTSFVLDPDRKIISRTEKTKFKDSDTKEYDWEIRSFRDEENLLESFLNKWNQCNFSIITGWNSNGFDLPMIYNRIRRVLGRKAGYRLSPIGIGYMNRFTQTMRIAGISCLDYMELYKKFIGKDQPSFSLGYIGAEEVEIGKVQYRGSLTTLYQQDLDKYIEYNLTDVKIVAALDKKLDFIYLARSVCHKGHVPYEWYMYSSRWIDGALLTYLHRNNLIAPNKPEGGKEAYEAMKEENKEGFKGAYVKDPVPGLYDWVCSADITSLYPSAIMTLNISPETKFGKIENWEAEKFANGQIGNVIINEKQYTADEFKALIADGKYSISSNGVLYRQDKVGIVPAILDIWFSERLEFKKLADDFKEKGDKEKEAFYDRRQKRQKIFLNSVYGTLGLPIFRFYDKDNAEATTTSGQQIIKMTERYVNMAFNDRYAAKKKTPRNPDFVIYIDTDSVYMSVQPLIDIEDKKVEDPAQYTIDFATEIAKGINEFYEFAVPSMFNLKKHRIKIVPDVICSTALWVKKKRYAMMKVYDMEKNKKVTDKDGSLGKLEVKGIDVVRTSFPAKFRKFSSELLTMILKKAPNSQIDDRILEMEKQIKTLPVEEVAKNTSVNFISRKGDANYNPTFRKMFTVPTSKTPPQVGAAMMYNDLLKKFGLHRQFEPIHNGQKIKWVYLKENPHALDYLAIKADGTDPDEIMELINTYVDRKAMYERELKTKIMNFYAVLRWVYPSLTAKIANSFFIQKEATIPVISIEEEEEEDDITLVEIPEEVVEE
jgi:DNA polymerase elongation subunit (family B)